MASRQIGNRFEKKARPTICWASVFLIAGFATSCGGGHMDFEIGRQAATSVSYRGEILPLFRIKCAGCHNATSSIPNWLDYETAARNKDKILYRTVTKGDMPMNGTLEPGEKSLIQAWVQAGAPEHASGGESGLQPDNAMAAPEPDHDRDHSGQMGGGRLTFEDTILPRIIQKRCAMCHNSSSAIPNWTDYDTAYRLRDRIYNRVVVAKTMPPNGLPMTDEERKMIGDWIDAGAPRGGGGGGGSHGGGGSGGGGGWGGDGGGSGGHRPDPQPTVTVTPSPVPTPTPVALTYDEVILPEVIQKRCVMCHNATSAVPNWTDYATAFRLRDKIYERIVISRTMPPAGMPMTDAERKLIGDWITGGAPKSSAASPPGLSPPPRVTYENWIKPEIFAKRCVACHHATGGLPNWLDYAVVREAKSKIEERVWKKKDMPMAPYTMTDQERSWVHQWIEAGAPEK